MRDGKKIKNNLIMGVFGQAMALILGIVVPKLVLTNYGSEVNGLLSSVTNIYAYIAIVEAGVAAAACQALYKPVAEGDRDRINQIMSATNRYYHRTGLVYFGLILAFATIYPLLISSEIPYTTVVLIILFNGFGNVINYFFHGKYLILLRADGKQYIRAGLETFTNTFKQLSKVVLIALGFDVVAVQFVAMLASFAQMAYITYYIQKHYAWVDLKAPADMGAISQSKNVLVHEVNYLVTSNVDTVLLTLFAGLKTVSVYSLYALLYETVNKLLRTVRDAVEFKVAHLFHGEKALFRKVFRAFEVYYITLAFALFTITNYFILPFLRIYTAGVTDAQYIDNTLPYLFLLINLLGAGRYPSDAMVHISGHFKQTQHSAVLETAINLVTSLVLVQFFGIVGVLIGTIVSSLYRTNYLIFYVNRQIIGRSVGRTYACWGINFGLFALINWVSGFLTADQTAYWQILLMCVPYALGVTALYVAVISLCMPDVCRDALEFLKTMMKRHPGDA